MIDLKSALLASDRSQAQRIVDLKFDAARDDVMGQMNRLINILGGQARLMEAEATEQGGWILKITIVILVVGTTATLIGAFVFAHFVIARPLRHLAGTMTQMALGNLANTIEGISRTDEVGAMARAVEVFRDNAVALREAEHLSSIEREQAQAEKREALEDVAVAFETDIMRVAATVERSATELEIFSRGIAVVTDESQRHARLASTNATEITSDAADVAAAIEELSISISDISTQLANASGIVAEATRCADSTATNTSALVSTVKDIDQVATMITAIANKTNLLASMPLSRLLVPRIWLRLCGGCGGVKALATQDRAGGYHGKTASPWRDRRVSAAQAIAGDATGRKHFYDIVDRSTELGTKKIAETVDDAAQHTPSRHCSIAGVSELAEQVGRGPPDVAAAASSTSTAAHNTPEFHQSRSRFRLSPDLILTERLLLLRDCVAVERHGYRRGEPRSAPTAGRSPCSTPASRRWHSITNGNGQSRATPNSWQMTIDARLAPRADAGP